MPPTDTEPEALAQVAPETCQAYLPGPHQIVRELPRFVCLERPALETGAVTLITAFTPDRLDLFLSLVRSYEGPVSAALFANDEEADRVAQALAETSFARRHRRVCVHLLMPDGLAPGAVPINRLRNLAWDHAPTPWVFHVDVDFEASNRTAFVVPAFETPQYRLPRFGTKAALLEAWDLGLLRPFRMDLWPVAHRPTDYHRWSGTTDPYAIDWQPDYEPYLLMSPHAPRFDERFSGFGWNKVSQIMELHVSHHRFVVVPAAWVIHKPHTPSHDLAAFRSDPGYRACLQALKEVFQSELAQRYGSGV
ncbi:uncharacterized protein MONBRDRAFT_21521 [Monosiga brevicollis MX1]|uniref:Glycosyltransferase-like protein LARGE2 n=1 Tax=Monosiga brevicollis TaxID=81824 RepID=A9UZY0_MONBE|nr:uncharacterized protein MONBRDRAFT_21521 [Monosiga brevicollis MX1]EDQ88919.1 predicted protein [Monosiga brevicollis MX1]|eukprot:XP_001746024.1 hypothetical protein [Monosiga brevicollis MX1]